jgi:hypothetical protein
MSSDGRRSATLALALLFAAPSLGEGESLNSNDNRAEVLKALEALEVGQDLRVTVLRGDKVVELTTKFTGF